MTTNMGFGGTVRRTTNGEILGAGDNVRVFSVHIISVTDTSGKILLREGGSSGTIKYELTGQAGTGFTDQIDNGLLFTNGCYADLDDNTTSVAIQCIKEC